DQVEQVRTHLVGLAFAEAVAGLALLGSGFATLFAGAGHQQGNLGVLFGLAIVGRCCSGLVATSSRSGSFSFRERNRVGGQCLHIGQDVGALFRRTDASEAHLGARSIGLRVFKECVEVFVGPDLTFSLLLEQN